MNRVWVSFIRWLARREIAEEINKRKIIIQQRDKLKAQLRRKEMTHGA